MKKFLLGAILMMASFSALAGSISITNPTTTGSGLLTEVTIPTIQYTLGSDFNTNEAVELFWDAELTGAALGLVDFTVSSSLANWSLSIFDGLEETVLSTGNQQNSIVTTMFTMTGNTVYNIIMTGTAAITSFTVGFTYPPSIAEVPLPAAVWLFGSILMGGLAMRRRSLKGKLQAVAA